MGDYRTRAGTRKKLAHYGLATLGVIAAALAIDVVIIIIAVTLLWPAIRAWA